MRTYRPADQAQVQALDLPYAAMHDVQLNVNINVCSSRLYIPQHEAQLLKIPPSAACDKCFAVKRLRNHSVRNYFVRMLRCHQALWNKAHFVLLTARFILNLDDDRVLHGVHERAYGHAYFFQVRSDSAANASHKSVGVPKSLLHH